ncbi:MAG: YegS/Rv2252/BmrU family lipid kinase [Bacteroidales bacterium]|nr:YegS/Rv2252/BmrU family lipid kinase [Bacteroidales bacterium]
MKICVLYNPKSGSSHHLDRIRDALSQLRRIRRMEFRTGDNLATIARTAIREGFDVIAIAGGDGTIHQVVNGLAPRFPSTPFIIFPLGTGNDFCRTLAMPLDAAEAVFVLRTGRVRTLDLIQMGGDYTGIVANAVTGGFGGQVATDVTPARKQSWGSLAYLRGAVGPIAGRSTYRVMIRMDDQPAIQIEILNIVIANGRTAAGGLAVAPLANPEGGFLDVVIVPAAGIADLSIISARLLEGDYIADELVQHYRAIHLEMESDPPIPLSIDGELVTGSRFQFTILPRAVRVYTGQGYVRYGQTEVSSATRWRMLAQRTLGLLGEGLFLMTRMRREYTLAWVTTLLSLFGFLVIADAVVEKDWEQTNQDVRAFVALHHSPLFDHLAVLLHWAGHYAVTTAIGLLVMLRWIRRRRYLEAALLLGVLLGCAILELLLKKLYQIARPDPVFWLEKPWSYSFPSGHTLRSVGLYGYLAVIVAYSRMRHSLRLLVAVCLILLAVLIALSRIYLGVHTFLDVLAGVFAAISWTASCLIVRLYAFRRKLARRALKG